MLQVLVHDPWCLLDHRIILALDLVGVLQLEVVRHVVRSVELSTRRVQVQVALVLDALDLVYCLLDRLRGQALLQLVLLSSLPDVEMGSGRIKTTSVVALEHAIAVIILGGLEHRQLLRGRDLMVVPHIGVVVHLLLGLELVHHDVGLRDLVRVWADSHRLNRQPHRRVLVQAVQIILIIFIHLRF